MRDRLPQPGTITPIGDGALTLQSVEGGPVYRLTVSGHRCAVDEVAQVAPDTIAIPPAGSMAAPSYADGRPLPPFDEVPLMSGLPLAPRATLTFVMSVAQNPMGPRAWHYTITDGRLAELRLVEDVFEAVTPGLVAPEGMDVFWRTDWDAWCRWRIGELSGEGFLARSVMRSSWPYVALAQGIFEHDEVVDSRRALGAPSADLHLLRLVTW